MLNYIKSEFYRIFHSASIYVTIAIFSGIPLCLNIALYLFGRFSPNFGYATTSFSFSNIVSSPMLFCYSALITVYVLYDRNKKNGNLKNVIAFGVSRTKIFIGQCIVSLIVSIIIAITAETVYISSALLLLPVQGPVTIENMLFEMLAVLPIAISALIFGIVVVQLFEHSFIGILVWSSVFCFIPQILLYIGVVVEPVREIALWFPQNIFRFMQVNLTQCLTVWDTPEGLLQCLTSGFIWIAVFSTFGFFSLKKKEL